MNLRSNGSSDWQTTRFEAELSAWLRTLEPSGIPIGLRLRASADLRAEADRPRRPLAWLPPALAPLASLAAVVLGAGLIMVLAVAGTGGAGGAGSIALPYVAGQAGSLPLIGGAFGPAESPYGLLLAAFASALVGRTFMLPWVPRLMRQLAFGRGAAQPAAPLPFRRPWRSIPLLTWALGAMAVATVLLTLWLLLVPGPFRPAPSMPQSAIAFYGQVVTAPIAFVVSWRYPRGDRSSRLLLFGAVGLTASNFFSIAVFTVSAPSLAEWFVFVEGVGAASMVAVAAGLAGRAGSVTRPPLWLAAVAGGATFLATTYSFFLMWFEPGSLADLNYAARAVVGYLAQWLVPVAWLAVAWIGLNQVRRHGRAWPWALILAAGGLQLLAALPDYAFRAWENLFNPVLSMDDWMSYAETINRFVSAVAAVSATALLAALLSGLRPAVQERLPPAAGPGSKGGRAGDAGTPGSSVT